MKELLFETDWLASTPVFYHEQSGKASHNINDVIDYTCLEFDPEGFNNYLDFGYSVFEQTPIRHVKFLRHSSRLMVHDDGRLEVKYLDDPMEKWIGRISNEDDVLHRLGTAIRRWEKSVEGEIIIPTSGGYDSRLLNFFIEDKSRIRSFSYGLSWKQSDSFEVVYAHKISEILGTRWEQIELGDYHRYFDEWDQLFGVSTHAHGMYHIEFYIKMLPRVEGRNPFLTGIFGDVWAGNVHKKILQSANDLVALGYTHGMNADSTQSTLKSDRPIRQEYWEKMRLSLDDDVVQTLALIRLKIILISYLLSVPRHFGFQPWSPFLDESIAMSMATLSPERRKDRLWQTNFFNARGIDVESIGLPVDKTNLLNFEALRRHPLQPLDSSLLNEVVQPSYLEWINKNLHQSSLQTMGDALFDLRKLGGAMSRLGFQKPRDRVSKAYCAYLVLKPIENLMKRRERSH